MKIFGFFEKVNRFTEVLVGIVFILPTFFLGQELYKYGFSTESLPKAIICVPFLIFGLVILLPRKLKRDMIIYFLCSIMLAFSSLWLGVLSIGNANELSYSLIPVGIICLFLAYKYFKKIRGNVQE